MDTRSNYAVQTLCFYAVNINDSNSFYGGTFFSPQGAPATVVTVFISSEYHSININTAILEYRLRA